jgi:hypothetical protein
MAYRKSSRYSRQLAAARAANHRERLETNPPACPRDIPEIRREMLVVDYDTGMPVVHHWVLRRTGRVDCYAVTENGTPWRGRHGWARILAQVRQRFPRVLSPLSL